MGYTFEHSRFAREGFHVEAILSCLRSVARFCPSGYGQVASAELSGTVTDATGAAVANAKVTATNVATNIERSTTTETNGNYIIPLLPPGDYILNVEGSGFRKVRSSEASLCRSISRRKSMSRCSLVRSPNRSR